MATTLTNCMKHTIFRISFAILTLLCSSPMVLAANDFWDHHIVRHVGMSDGLPGNLVDNVCLDDKGFTWFAMGGNGLVRYDGYSFREFNVANTPALRSNFVHSLALANDGKLWIGTDCGVSIFDTRSEQMTAFPLVVGKDTLADAAILHLAADNNGLVWLAAHHSIVAIGPSSASDATPVVLDKVDLPAVVTSIERGSRGIYAASASNIYVCQFSPERREVTIRQDQHPNLTNSAAIVESIAESSGFLWVGTDIGIFRYNLTTGEESIYRHNDADPTTLTQDRITDIATDQDGRVIVATLKGLNIYNHESDSFERITQEDSRPGKSLSSNFINCLTPTSQGVWVGTDVAGAELISPINLNVVNVTTEEIAGRNPNLAISPNRTIRPVNSIVEDHDGTLWVGAVEGGLARRPRGSKTFSLITRADGLCHNSVSCMTVDERGLLYVGTWGGGVDIIDPSRRTRPIVHHFGVSDGLHSDFIGAIIADNINHGVWVASINGICFIRQESVLQPIPASTFNDMNGALGADIDNRGRLWVGTSLGLFEIDLNSFNNSNLSISHRLICHRLDNPDVHGDPRVTFIFFSQSKNRLYISTNGFGIYEADTNSPDTQFHPLTTETGLANNNTVSIAEDGDGNIWIGTQNGLSLLSADQDAMSSFFTTDGLLSDCYYWNAAWTSRQTGHVFIGNLYGFSEIGPSPKSAGTQSRRAPVLTRLIVNNTPVSPSPDGIISSDIEDAESVEIHEADKSFSIEFSSLYYPAPSAVRYQYRLDGFDDDWVTPAKGQRSAQYTNLSAGDYKLRIRSVATNGRWSTERILKVTVTPYFYKTTWFYVIMGILIIGAVMLIFRLRMRAIEANRKMLRKEVELRTHELEVQKHILEEQKAQLEESNSKLTEQNDFIVRQKENILEMTSKIQRLSIDKLQFFTNISHELRSPLTLITGPVRRAKQLTKLPEVTEQLDLIERSANSLLQTVNQLMDFRKVETGNMEIHPVSTNLEDYVTSMVAPYVAYAAEQGVRLRSFFHVPTPYVRIDTDALTKILANLLSNAIKYSGDGKIIDLFVCQLREDGKLRTYICVRDRGIGIPADRIDKVFDRFFQSAGKDGNRFTSVNSTGIGLYVVNRIIQECDGEIKIRNNQTRGVSVRVIIPTPEGRPADAADALTPAQAEAQRQTDAANADEPISPVAERMTILVVEDSADMRTYIRSFLEDTYHVVEAENGVDGLTALAENDVDFIIADLMMPVMDGLEFARKVKADFAYSHTPILILTAQMDGQYQTESYRIGVESYLHKPFDEEMLKARISGILASKQKNQNRFLTTLDTADLGIERESEDEKFVERVTSFVKANYKDPDLSIDDIVSEVGCSKSMLHKKMQSVMGQAPGNFIRTYRLNIAREILANKANRLNVSQVAYEVGFNDPKYFSRCFAKAFGYPPSAIG